MLHSAFAHCGGLPKTFIVPSQHDASYSQLETSVRVTDWVRRCGCGASPRATLAGASSTESSWRRRADDSMNVAEPPDVLVFSI